MVRKKLARFSRDALLYGAGDAVGRLVGLVMFPILSRIFVPADYGAIDLLMVSGAVAAQFAQFGVPSGLQRYYYKREADARRVLVATSIASVAVFALMISAVGIVLAPALSSWFPEEQVAVAEAIRWIALSLPFVTVADQVQLLLRLQNRAVVFSVLNVAKVVIQPVLTAIAVVGFDLGIRGVFVAHAATAIVTSLASLWLVRRAMAPRFEIGLAHELVRFGLPGQPAVLIVLFMQMLPRYILALFAPLSTVGLFGVAVRVAGVQRVFVRAFAQAWNPFAFANEGASDEVRLYKFALRGAIAVVSWLSLAFGIYAPELLRALAPAEYGAAAWIVPGIALHFAVDGLTPIFGTILYTRGAVRWTSYITTMRLVAFLVCAFALVPHYSTAGLIASMLMSVGVQLAAYVVVSQRRFPIAFPWIRAGLVLAIDGLALALTLAAPLPPIPLIGLKFIVLAACLVASIGLLLDPADRTRVNDLLKRTLGRERSART